MKDATSRINFLARWRSLVTARNSNRKKRQGKMTEVIEARKVNFPLDISDCI